METAYDWVSVTIFGGLIVLFMSRATSEDDDEAALSIAPYLFAGLGCAVGNYFGNQENHPLAVFILGATLVGVVHFVHPFKAWPRRGASGDKITPKRGGNRRNQGLDEFRERSRRLTFILSDHR
jgi:hypothetical protein